MTDAIKPCPFCGEVEDAQPCGTGDEYDTSPQFFVACMCGASAIPCDTEDEAVRAWNNRAPLATDEELRVLQDVVIREAEDAARIGVYSSRAATLSALERRLRGVE